MQSAANALPLTCLDNGLRDAMVLGNLEKALTNLPFATALAMVLFLLAARLASWKER